MNALRHAAAICLAAVALFFAVPANASTFAVNPVRAELSPAAPTQILSVTNTGTERVRLQMSANAWSETPTGQMLLAPTEDVLFFPALLSLDPGETRKVRVGTTAAFGAIEKSYRLFVQELPPLGEPGAPGAIRVLTRMGIPVFVKATAPSILPLVAGLGVHDRTMSFSLKGAGNTHFVAQKIDVSASDAAGRILFQQTITGWYVLPGGERRYEITLPGAACTAAKVEVKVESEAPPVKAQLTGFRACQP